MELSGGTGVMVGGEGCGCVSGGVWCWEWRGVVVGVKGMYGGKGVEESMDKRRGCDAERGVVVYMNIRYVTISYLRFIFTNVESTMHSCL